MPVQGWDDSQPSSGVCIALPDGTKYRSTAILVSSGPSVCSTELTDSSASDSATVRQYGRM